MDKLSFTKGIGNISDTVQSAIDVDVMPVMNMFIILIPFLVSMAVFTQMAIIEFSVPPEAGAHLSDVDEKPRLRLTIVYRNSGVLVTYGANVIDTIEVNSLGAITEPDRFIETLETLRTTVDIQDEVVIAISDEVEFNNVVKVMDISKLAGFEKIGLSQAAKEFSPTVVED